MKSRPHSVSRTNVARALARAALATAAALGLAAAVAVASAGALGTAATRGEAFRQATRPLPRALRMESDPSVAAYRGLGAWVDIFDEAAFDQPEAAVRDMASRGVTTLFVETGNSNHAAIHRPDRMRRLIRAAHGRGMRVVAWYLPTLRNPESDYRKVRAAIDFRAFDGQRFDSFVLDIESSAVSPVAERNRRLISLSRRIRAYVGARYALGACIPSPKGMAALPKYWRPFPYAELASTYDVFLTMGYYTYHGNGVLDTTVDTMGNVRELRAQEGCAEKPIHLIGGLAADSSGAETRAFVDVAVREQVQGASIYDWATTGDSDWAALQRARTLGRVW